MAAARHGPRSQGRPGASRPPESGLFALRHRFGALRFEAPPGQPTPRGTVPIAHAAIGGQWELVLPERVLLRAEIRMRVSGDRTGQPGQEGYGDGTVSVGLTIPF